MSKFLTPCQPLRLDFAHAFWWGWSDALGRNLKNRTLDLGGLPKLLFKVKVWSTHLAGGGAGFAIAGAGVPPENACVQWRQAQNSNWKSNRQIWTSYLPTYQGAGQCEYPDEGWRWFGPTCQTCKNFQVSVPKIEIWSVMISEEVVREVSLVGNAPDSAWVLQQHLHHFTPTPVITNPLRYIFKHPVINLQIPGDTPGDATINPRG